jgi:hypothetical protein
MIMERLLLTPDQVAESLGVCRSRVYDLMRTRMLPSVRLVALVGCQPVRSAPTWTNSLTRGTCLECPRERRGFCLSSPRWALGRLQRMCFARTAGESVDRCTDERVPRRQSPMGWWAFE